MRSVNDRHSSFPDGRAHLGQYCLKAQKDTVLLYELYPPQKKWLVSFCVGIEIYLLTSVPLYPVTQLQIFFNVS